MIYTMNGMATTLNLQANEPGTFMGLSAMFSGNGFADMQFKAEAVRKAEFDAWAKETSSSGSPTLGSEAYKVLSVQSMTGAAFLIHEMNRPYTGVMQVSIAPIRNALSQMNR